MFWMKKRSEGRLSEEEAARTRREPPIVSITLDGVKRLVRDYEEQMPKGINRTVLIGPDNEIDFRLLIPYLHGLPDAKFYMSRETYEIFPEEERHIPQWLDIVQRAVDGYIAEEGAVPVIAGDKRRKINCVLLQDCYFLKERPPIDFYLSDQEDLITHIPEDK